MTPKVINVDAYEVSELASNKWLADSGASRHICNDMRMLWDVRQLDTLVIVRRMVGQVPLMLCGTIRSSVITSQGKLC